MLYLFLGEDSQEKDKQLYALKNKVLSTNDAEKFDYGVLDAQRCSPEDFKKSLLALPAVAPQRLLVIRQAHALLPQNKDILVDFMAAQPKHIVIVLETHKYTLPKKIGAGLKSLARVEVFGTSEKKTIFDVADLMVARKPTAALKLVSQLLDEGQEPVMLTGGLVWYWGKKLSRRVAPEVFESGLRVLQQADLNIKRTRLPPRQAVELLVVELMQLLG